MVQIAGKQIPKWLVVLLAVGVVVGVAGNVSSCLDRKVAPTSTAVTSEPARQPETPAATPKPAPPFASGPVTEAAVKAALSGIDLAKVEVQDNLGTDAPDDQIVHISYKPVGAAGLGEKPMLMDLTKVSADVFEQLFANPKVGAADVTAVVVMSSGGVDEQTAGARIYWDRKMAGSVDFRTYRADVVNGYFWDAFTGAPDSYVHPGVLAGLSEADRAKLER